MAKTVHRENTYRNQPRQNREIDYGKVWQNLLQDDRVRLALGLFLLLSSVSLLIAFTSYFFTWQNDQSVVEQVFGSSIKKSGQEVENWLGLSGAVLAHLLIYRWFGICSLVFVLILFLLGWKLAFRGELLPINRTILLSIFILFWGSTLLGFLFMGTEANILSGGIGYEIALITDSLVSSIGTFLLLGITLTLFVINFFDVKNLVQSFSTAQKRTQTVVDGLRTQVKKRMTDKKATTVSYDDDQALEIEIEPDDPFEPLKKTKVINLEDTQSQTKSNSKSNLENTEEERLDTVTPIAKTFKPNLELEINEETPLNEEGVPLNPGIQKDIKFEKINFDFEKTQPQFAVPETPQTKEIQDWSSLQDEFDPTLDLSHYKYPTAELLDEPPQLKRQVTNEELEANKDRIVATLSNYGIGISQIKATIGPTVTLYEIIPEAGVRISKIKNLEDDIALSLAALGIRIIAPIPGKGTIGIEVPNKKREVVAMRGVLVDEAYQNSNKDLPIILGKTIANEVFVTDLAKMPHLLMAGATGQGKSVAINAFMVSLIYKKHPAELKFVLIDPKKVELSLFNHIEKHFLAKLPGEEEAIITDNSKVVNTLNSLTVEMDERYNLLKEAGTRNIKEYNRKFVGRKLNPRKGHKFLPYIVLVIDELADLMMTAGKEVEQPIARLAQLARAVGIHLIVATQRPSVNVITGIIKANFPARLSFKVTSKIDSRTILDTGGAEQLVGMGDMLFSQGSEMVRLQGAFVDTPEVERICDYIGAQQGYTKAYELPEFVTGDGSGGGVGEDFERDTLFEEAARVIVMHQQGSTSLLQRRLKLGYNRAGRLIDQLEKAGIVGPFEGSKAREVLIPDEYSLERLLNSLSK